MIYHSYNFVDSFSNAVGNRKDRMILGELGKLIKEHPQEVIIALEDSDIKVPKGITKKGLIRLIIQNKRNRRLINNLSVLIYASASFDGGYDFLGRKKDGGSGEKSGILAKVGEWIQNRKERKAERQAQSGGTSDAEKKNIWQKIGSFFNKNKEQIGDVSSALADSLQQQQAQRVVTANVKTTTAPTQQAGAGGMSKQTKTYLVVGAIALVGIFLYMRRNK